MPATVATAVHRPRRARLSPLPLPLPLLLLLLLLPATSHANQNPCHPAKVAQGHQVTCRRVILPPSLCSACRLKPWRPNGNFANCASIYNIQSPPCRQKLLQYAKFNKHCDPVRWRQTRDFRRKENLQGLDYFVYSVCEQCCDCVPRGAKVHEYARRKAQRTLMYVNRGNCPAHAVYDICKIWPRVKFVSPVWHDAATPWWWPEICPRLRNWAHTPANFGWLLKRHLVVEPVIKRFFARFFHVVRCNHHDVWKPCVRLERAQKRL